MAKILVTKNNFEQFISKGDNKFYVDKKMILSTCVKDILRDKGMTIVYGKKEDLTKAKIEINNCTVEDEIKIIAAILKNEFNIADDNDVGMITQKVLKKIRG